jgi:hypothetical protein
LQRKWCEYSQSHDTTFVRILRPLSLDLGQ